MKRVVIVGVLILVCAVAVFFFMYTKPKASVVKEGSIVIVGDSLVSGVGASKGNDIASLLSTRLGEEIINAGIAGNTTQGVLDRLERDVLAYNPGIAVVIVGGNDFLRRVPKETTLANIRAILDKLNENGASVVLVGIDTLVYNSDYRAIANDYDARFISNLLGSVRSDSALMSDPIHPNDAGYVLFANAIEEEIRLMRP